MSAQNRTALEDSVIIGGISRYVVDMAIGEDQTPEEKLTIQWTYAEAMKDISREHLNAFSDQELRDILSYYRSDACRYLKSSTFVNVCINNIINAIQYELGVNPDFSYQLNDKSYGKWLDSQFQIALAATQPVLEEMIGKNGTVITNARKSGASETDIKLIKKAVQNIMNNLPSLIKLSLIDYLSNDALDELAKFNTSPLGQKFAVYSKTVNDQVDLTDEKYYEELVKDWYVPEKANELKKAITEYVSISRAFPEYFPELYRPHEELVIGKSTYIGQTRDRLPHGKGRLVDKKGVVYEGDFRNGKRHGQITVLKPGKNAEVEFWHNDRCAKGILATANEDGSIFPAQVISGKQNGYGQVYDNGSVYQGLFVDGNLNGYGEVSEPTKHVKGEFIDGKLINGTIIFYNDDYKVNQFKGMAADRLRKGFHDWINKDNTRKVRQFGVFIDGLLDGEGQTTVLDSALCVESSGIFAYGKLYGNGTQRIQTIYKDSGINVKAKYIGDFYADSFHGNGTCHTTYTDIPEGQWTFTNCDVKLPYFKGDSLTVTMEGYFESGSFKKGKISYSDGSWFEGTFSRSGLMEGRMYRKYSDGSYYIGDCKDGKIHGDGEIHYSDGTSYKGKFEFGSPVNATSKLPRFSEDFKQPEIEDDVLIMTYHFDNLPVEKGKVRLVKAAGVKIMVRKVSSLDVTCKGHFDKKTMTLLDGKVTMSDGNWMEGTFEDGVLIHGRGRSLDKYGTIYEGDIKNGFPHGKGKCIYSDGTWFKGRFVNGNRMEGTHYTADGKVIKVYE